MDGIHDTGGIDGFPRPDPSGDDEYFDVAWERAAFAMMPSLVGQDVVNMHEFRHGVERMGAVEYLRTPYYEHWLASFERLLVEKDVVDEGTLVERIASASVDDVTLDPDASGDPDVAAVMDLVESGKDRGGPAPDPRFGAGDDVRVKNEHPTEHTRCPDYVRRATGTVDERLGSYVLPDANAHGERREEPVYSVAFSPRELWGPDGEANETIFVDLWESYLEPADAGQDAGGDA